MAQPDDGRGNLYEQVLEYAKREMDEAASKMGEIKQSLELLEARVEAAKAVYQAVASRLNLEDEADGSAFETSYPDTPVQAPEPPPATVEEVDVSTAEASTPVQQETVSDDPVSSNGSTEPPAPADAPNVVDLNLIRQHLSERAEREADPPAPNPVSAPEPALAQTPNDAPSSEKDDSFSLQLIRQHLEQKAKQQETAPAAPEPTAPEPISAEPATPDPVAQPKGGAGGGLSEADRELIGAYLKSKQN